ncbi:uncharacterized protein LOC135391906 [Ornithodoros turicata]
MENVRVVDLRSDTITKPTAEMRQAMKDAEVGDDVMREDPTVNDLQQMVAEMLGKEASLFIPTGTMGNLAAVMAHCNGRGQEVLVGDQSHIFLNEQGGIAQFGGVHSWAVPTQRDGTLLVQDLEDRFRKNDFHCPKTSLVCLENTHNFCGGTVLPLAYLDKVALFKEAHNLPLHMDGARIMNAAVALDVKPSVVLKDCDSVNICFSKGLACPVGSLVAGTQDFVERIRRIRKALGGGMRQVGVLAAAGIVALKTVVPRLHEDHEHAQILARGVDLKDNPLIHLDLNSVQTNMVIYEFPSDKLLPTTFCKRLQEVTPQELEDLDESIHVKMLPITVNKARAVFHNDVSRDDVDLAMKKIRYVVGQFSKD